MEHFDLVIFLFLVSNLIILVGRVWFLIESFRVSIWWGLGVLFIPFVDIIFLFTHWREVHRAFFLQLLGIALALLPFLFETPKSVMKTYSCATHFRVTSE